MVHFLRHEAPAALRVLCIFRITVDPVGTCNHTLGVRLCFISRDNFYGLLAQVSELVRYGLTRMGMWKRFGCVPVFVLVAELQAGMFDVAVFKLDRGCPLLKLRFDLVGTSLHLNTGDLIFELPGLDDGIEQLWRRMVRGAALIPQHRQCLCVCFSGESLL